MAKKTKEDYIGNGLYYTKMETTPPARYQESSLVKALESNGCGRPSTFATIVETVLSQTRGYATLENKYIVPTERGIQLSEFLDRNFSDIINVKYTSEMEADLDKIAEGAENNIEFLTNFYNNLENEIKNNQELKNSNIGQKTNKICPKCGAPMVLRRSRFGKLFYGCSKFPKCNGIVSITEKDSI